MVGYGGEDRATIKGNLSSWFSLGRGQGSVGGDGERRLEAGEIKKALG